MHNGGHLSDITLADCIEAYRAQTSYSARQHSHWYLLLGQVGILPADAPPSVWAASRRGPLTVEELVDGYDVTCGPIRDLLVDYLHERQAALDYSSLRQLASKLVLLFWRDLEINEPGIDSLHLTDEVARRWKERLRHVRYGNHRIGKLREDPNAILMSVRSFYADLAAWALEDPGRWAIWAVPNPVSGRDLLGQNKQKKRATARMHQRIRELAPALPALVEAADRRRRHTAALLEAARLAPPGSCFEVGGECLERVSIATDPARGGTGRPGVVYAIPPGGGPRRNLTLEDDHGFWAWAVVEVLRHTGVRIEEMLELTHASFVAYTLPTTGEVIPLLQVTPSKTDQERLLVVSPELAEVLSAIISRVRGTSERLPLVSRYDGAERLHSPPLPFLFQRPWGVHQQIINPGRVKELLDRTAVLAGLAGMAGTDGRPLRFTPHDFRRIFATEAVATGLPVHIAAKLLGHQNLATTQGYIAVYDQDVIDHHRAFIARRRSIRPSAEYREPTDAEWTEFLGHFERRKVELGTCGRAVRHSLPARTRLHSLPDAAPGPSSARSAHRDRRQPRRPAGRGTRSGLARRGRGPGSEPCRSPPEVGNYASEHRSGDDGSRSGLSPARILLEEVALLPLILIVGICARRRPRDPTPAADPPTGLFSAWFSQCAATPSTVKGACEPPLPLVAPVLAADFVGRPLTAAGSPAATSDPAAGNAYRLSGGFAMSPTRTTPEQRNAKLEAAHRQLVDAVASVASSEGWLRYLAAMHRFHDYSATNVMMILFQRPDAQRVAGYRTWQALGRQVKKGSQGIAIWAPCARRVEREDETTGESVTARTLSGFRLVHVFDVADTEGEPLPDHPVEATLLTGEAPDGMWTHLAIAGRLGRFPTRTGQ